MICRLTGDRPSSSDSVSVALFAADTSNTDPVSGVVGIATPPWSAGL